MSVKDAVRAGLSYYSGIIVPTSVYFNLLCVVDAEVHHLTYDSSGVSVFWNRLMINKVSDTDPANMLTVKDSALRSLCQ
jgi:hypothetical protein